MKYLCKCKCRSILFNSLWFTLNPICGSKARVLAKLLTGVDANACLQPTFALISATNQFVVKISSHKCTKQKMGFVISVSLWSHNIKREKKQNCEFYDILKTRIRWDDSNFVNFQEFLFES